MSDNPFRHPWPKGSRVAFVLEAEEQSEARWRIGWGYGTIRKYYADSRCYTVLTSKGSTLIHQSNLVMAHD